MRPIQTNHATTAFVALAILADCGRSSQMAPMPLARPAESSQYAQRPPVFNGFLMHGGVLPGHGVTRPSFMDPEAVRKPLVFVSDAATSVNIYLQARKNKMVGQITGFAYSADVATDAARNLYVTDLLGGNVKVFAPPYTKGPKLTINTTGGYPELGIAVSSQGVVGVPTCIVVSGSKCNHAVVLYASGSTMPCATVPLDGSSYAGLGWAAFDHRGSLYVEGATSNTLNNPIIIAKINGGCRARSYRTLTLGNTIDENNVGGIKVDKEGRVAIVDTLSSGSVQIDTYDPPKGGSLGNPVSIISLVGLPYGGPLTFLASGRRVWVGNSASSDSPTASEYTYPAGGAPQKSISVPQPYEITYGVAVTPALVRKETWSRTEDSTR